MSDHKKQALKAIREAGYTAYMRDQENDSWCYFTDGTRIGCAEFGRSAAASHGVSVHLCTVHKPNKETGTGFSLDGDALTPADFALAFEYAPAWATGKQRASVVKYRDWAEFKARDSFNAEYKPVNYEELS